MTRLGPFNVPGLPTAEVAIVPAGSSKPHAPTSFGREGGFGKTDGRGVALGSGDALGSGLGTAAVIAVYVLLNLLYLFVLPVGELAKVQGSVLDVIDDRLLNQMAGNVMGFVSIISLAASISANIFAGPRVYFAMARDGFFLPAAARIHPRFKTPAAAIVAQAVWSGLLVLTGSGSALTTYTGFAVILFAGVAVGALFVLRRREPDAPRPFKAWGYPLAPALFTVTSALIVINALWTDLVRPLAVGGSWGPAAAGLVVIALGLPVYFLLRSRPARA